MIKTEEELEDALSCPTPADIAAARDLVGGRSDPGCWRQNGSQPGQAFATRVKCLWLSSPRDRGCTFLGCKAKGRDRPQRDRNGRVRPARTDGAFSPA